MSEKLFYISALFLFFVLLIHPGGSKRLLRIRRVVPDINLSTRAGYVTIEGENFRKGSLVYIGGKLVRKARLLNEQRIKVELPSDLGQGTFPLRIIAPGRNEDELSNGITLLPSETAPVVTKVVPCSLCADKAPVRLVIYGCNFRKGAKVLVGRTCRPEIVTAAGDRLEVRIISPLEAGEYDISVVNPDGENGVLHSGLSVKEVRAP